MFKKTRLYKFAEKIAKLEEDLVWFDAVDNEDFKNQFVAWIQEQLQSGEDGDGEIMGLYSYATEIISQGRKQQGDPYTLEDTGDFYKSIFLVAMVDELILEAETDKGDEDLYEKFGKQITKLNDENFQLLKEKVKESYKQYIRRLLHNTR